MSTLSTHVIDVTEGVPLVGVGVLVTDDRGVMVARGETGNDGRITKLGNELASGNYQVTWEMAEAFLEVTVTVRLTDDRHYHLPLLSSPFSATVYLGA